MQSALRSIRRGPEEGQAKGLVVLLHGLGSNEQDLFGLAGYLDPSLVVCSLRAPLEYGSFGYAWFSLDVEPQGIRYDLDEARQSLAMVLAEVHRLQTETNIGAAKTVLAGFSQGSMLSTAALFDSPDVATAFWLMSGASVPELEKPFASDATTKSVLIQHGLYDEVVPIERGRQLKSILETEKDVYLTYREYPMAHTITEDSLRDATAWIDQILGL